MLSSTARHGGDILLSPSLFVPAANGFVVFDAGDLSLKKVDPDGRLIWTQGRSGSGPGEYRHVIDLRATPEGTFGVLDEGNGRLTIVSGAGKHRSDAKLPGRLAKLLSVDDKGQAELLEAREWRIVTMGNGRSTMPRSMWAPRMSDELLVNEPVFAARTAGAIDVLGFRWTSDVFVRANGRVSRFVAVDSVKAPVVIIRDVPGTKLKVKRVDPAAKETTLAVDGSASCVAVLTALRNSEDSYVVDFYSTKGSYGGSMRVGGQVSQMALSPRGVHVLVLDPVPAVVTYATPPSACS